VGQVSRRDTHGGRRLGILFAQWFSRLVVAQLSTCSTAFTSIYRSTGVSWRLRRVLGR
jgi:hypothetical protein